LSIGKKQFSIWAGKKTGSHVIPAPKKEKP